MGNSSSTNSSQKISITAGNMLNVQAGGNFTEQQTIKFSRNDLVDTVSALDLNSVFELHGGSKNINLNNIPSRNRYSEYTTTKTMKMNGGSRGGVIGGYSSTSEGDLSIIKGMILGRQNGGGGGCGTPGPETPAPSAPTAPAPAPTTTTPSLQGGNGAGCGCETNSVLNGGAFNLGKILSKQMTATASLTESSSYNPLNSMDLTSENMYGGNASSSTQSLSATSSEMAGGFNSVLSATSPVAFTQNGGNIESSSLFSATSPLSISQNGGNLSATSPFGMSQMKGGNLSATSQSATSSLPINYDSLIGGKKKNKGKKDNKSKKEKASDSSSTEQSESSGRLLMIEDMDASSSSTGSESEDDSDAVIARALRSDAPSEKTRELQRFSSEKQTHKSDKKRDNKHKVKDSPSSSSGSSGTSTVSSESKSTSSKSNSSSSTDGDAIAKVNSYKYANLIVTSPNSASISDSLINAKQFYSSENGELFSSESNFLRNNINKNRLR